MTTPFNWNAWFETSFNNLMKPHVEAVQQVVDDISKAVDENTNDTNKALDNIVQGEFGRRVGLHDKKILELLEIMQAMIAGNEYLRGSYVGGRIDQVMKDFRAQLGIEPKQAVTTTRQDDGEDEFMEKCISNLEDQGVDDAEDVCANLWQEQREQRSSGLAKTLSIIAEVLND